MFCILSFFQYLNKLITWDTNSPAFSLSPPYWIIPTNTQIFSSIFWSLKKKNPLGFLPRLSSSLHSKTSLLRPTLLPLSRHSSIPPPTSGWLLAPPSMVNILVLSPLGYCHCDLFCCQLQRTPFYPYYNGLLSNICHG